jgi:hypothetical protein
MYVSIAFAMNSFLVCLPCMEIDRCRLRDLRYWPAIVFLLWRSGEVGTAMS